MNRTREPCLQNRTFTIKDKGAWYLRIESNNRLERYEHPVLPLNYAGIKIWCAVRELNPVIKFGRLACTRQHLPRIYLVSPRRIERHPSVLQTDARTSYARETNWLPILDSNQGPFD